MSNVIVKFEDVSKKYMKQMIIKNLNLEIYEGEFLTLLGPSGCGKTTILRMISGLEEVTEGKVYIDNEDVTYLDPTKRQVNTVFQNFALFPHMSVYDNVAFGLKMKKMPKDEINKKVMEAIRLVNLTGFETRFPRELSGGQQQRVAIARGIVMKPKVLLLDESLCSLDLKLKRKMQIELKRIQKKLGITFIYVTHDQNEAITMSDRIAVVNKGKIQQLDTPFNIYSKPVDAFVGDFIGESNIYKTKVVKNVNKECVQVKVLDSNVVFNVATTDTYKKNDDVCLLVRPENIKVSKNDLKDSVSGDITDAIYMGDYTRLYVSVDGVAIKIDVTDGTIYHDGDKVNVKIEPSEFVIIGE